MSENEPERGKVYISDEELPEDLQPTEDEETAAHEDLDPEETAGADGLDPEDPDAPDDPLPEG